MDVLGGQEIERPARRRLDDVAGLHNFEAEVAQCYAHLPCLWTILDRDSHFQARGYIKSSLVPMSSMKLGHGESCGKVCCGAHTSLRMQARDEYQRVDCG